jgi:hypothetical protein
MFVFLRKMCYGFILRHYVIDDNIQFRNKSNDIEDFVSFPFYFYILMLTYHNYNTLRHITTFTIYGSINNQNYKITIL